MLARKTMSRRWIALLAVGLLLIAAAVLAYRLSTFVVTYSVAVGPAESEDAKLVSRFAAHLVETGSYYRIHSMPALGPIDAAAKLQRGEADLAVIRGDANLPTDGRAIALLQKSKVILAVAPARREIKGIAGLAGRTIAVTEPFAANRELLKRILQFKSVPHDKVTIIDVPLEKILQETKKRSADAVLVTAPISERATFLDIEGAEALVEAYPGLETTEIPAGAFGSNPTRPAESIDTVEFGVFLAARSSLPDAAAAALAKALLGARSALAIDVPYAMQIKAAPTDKDARIAVHPGAAAYFDGTEKTFFERYGDWLFYGPLIAGLLSTGFMGVHRWMAADDTPNSAAHLATTARGLADRIRLAKTPDELAALERQIEEFLFDVAARLASGRLEDQQAQALSTVARLLENAMTRQRLLVGLNREREALATSLKTKQGGRV